jgi:hypothetical protein
MLLRKLLAELREASEETIEQMVENTPEIVELPGQYQLTGYSQRSLFSEAEKDRLQTLQVKIYSVRNQIYSAHSGQAQKIMMLLSQVQMYNTELNEITERACQRHGG